MEKIKTLADLIEQFTNGLVNEVAATQPFDRRFAGFGRAVGDEVGGTMLSVLMLNAFLVHPDWAAAAMPLIRDGWARDLPPLGIANMEEWLERRTALLMQTCQIGENRGED